MRPAALILGLLLAVPAVADVIVPVRTIRPREIIGEADMTVKQVNVAGALTSVVTAVGMEARVALYPGRPVHPQDIGPPAIVGRNDLVPLVYLRGGLRIVTEGRALGRGAAGETVRVMNLASRATLTGRIAADGTIEVK